MTSPHKNHVVLRRSLKPSANHFKGIPRFILKLSAWRAVFDRKPGIIGQKRRQTTLRPNKQQTLGQIGKTNLLHSSQLLSSPHPKRYAVKAPDASPLGSSACWRNRSSY